MGADSNDLGLVYYQDHHLRLRAPPGYDMEGIHVAFLCKKNCFQYSEGSLFKMCLECIAQNMDLLDSLVGLPELVGHQLFQHMTFKGYFHFESFPCEDPTTSDLLKLKVLRIFNDAYKHLVLSSFSTLHLTLSTAAHLLPFLTTFQSISYLDISDVELTSSYLAYLSHLHQLEAVVLENASITDKKIADMMLPFRVYKERGKVLKSVDIAKNPKVTAVSFPCFLVLSKLEELDVSECNVKVDAKFMNLLRLKGYSLCTSGKRTERKSLCGWAQQVVHLALATTCVKKIDSLSRCSKFYGKGERPSEGRTSEDKLSTLYLKIVRDLTTLQPFLQVSPVISSYLKPSCALPMKRPYACLESEDDEVTDISLLCMYKKPSVRRRPRQDASVFDAL